MRRFTFETIAARIAPHVPGVFREGRRPYLLSVIWLLMAAMVAAPLITPYPHGVLVPWSIALALLVLQGLAIFECISISLGVNLGLMAGLLGLSYLAWMTGGVFSPRMAWVPLLPLVAFYAISRRAGWAWLATVVVVECVMAYATWQAWLPAGTRLTATHASASWVSYTVVTWMLITVPFLYDRSLRQAYEDSVQRHRMLEDKRQALLRTSAQREQFIAAVSHELRTPMNAILGFNQMLITRTTNNPRALKILNHTRQSADHLLTVINDVLDYSQLQAGKLNVHPETFALRDTVNTAFELFAQRIESMRLQYTCEIDAQVPHWVRTDRHRLMQILVNLLGNAIKFTHEGHVTLVVRQQPMCVHFSVRDSGIGIAPEQQAKIFQRFVQADDDIQSRYGGNGLGLSITQRLVALMGGHIGFESQPGQGSVFWFTLPLVEVEPPQAPVPPPSPVWLATDDVPHFLLVDDHAINRLLLRQILRSHWHNCELFEAENGTQALEALRQHRFDVVFMDMVMPEMDGIETTAALRQTLPLAVRDVPVLGLTANVNPQDLERFTSAGVNAVVLKPFDAAQVCAQVQAMLTARRSSLGS